MTTEESLPLGKLSSSGRGLCSAAKMTFIFWLCWYLAEGVVTCGDVRLRAGGHLSLLCDLCSQVQMLPAHTSENMLSPDTHSTGLPRAHPPPPHSDQWKTFTSSQGLFSAASLQGPPVWHKIWPQGLSAGMADQNQKGLHTASQTGSSAPQALYLRLRRTAIIVFLFQK